MTAQPDATIHATLKLDDLVKVQFWSLKASYWRLFLIILLVGSILTILDGFVSAFSSGKLILWILFWIIFSAVWYPLCVLAALAILLFRWKFGSIPRSVKFSLTQESIRVANEQLDFGVPWGRVRRVIDTGGAMVFMLKGRGVIRIPKRAIPDEQIGSLTQFVRDHVTDIRPKAR